MCSPTTVRQGVPLRKQGLRFNGSYSYFRVSGCVGLLIPPVPKTSFCIRSEVIGLYGLIVALILNTRVGEAQCSY